MRLVLASASPQRKDLLLQIGARPDRILCPDIDETPLVGEKPRHYCRRLATEKANAIDITSGDIILAADTTVAVGRLILGKPESAAMAQTFLRRLSGRRHRVITAVAVKTVAYM
ncbi:MAG: Maf family protein, partial [Rhodobacteraceae bacterium]|nr:Maf family protein [Paracoccaceae bacterium]